MPASTGGLPGRGWLLRLACVVWLCGLLCAPAVRAQSHDAAVLLLNQKTTPNDLWRALQVRTGLPENSSLPGAADVAAGDWRPAGTSPLGNLGPQRQPVALALVIEVAADGGGAWVLDIDYPSLDHIELVLSDADGRNTLKRWTLGDHHPYSQRPMASRSFAVPLDLQAGQRYRLTGLVRTTGSMILPLRLSRPEAFRHTESGEGLLQGWLAGAMFCLLMYALVQGRATREWAFGWFALNVMGTTLFFVSYQGLGLEHGWGDNAWASEKMTMLGGLVGLGSAVLYLDSVLELDTRSRWLSRTLRAMSLALLAVFVLFAVGLVGYRTAHFVNVMLSPAPLILVLPTAWRRARAGDSMCRQLLAGWAVFAVCTICFAVLQRGLLPVGFWVSHAFQFGNLFELVTWVMMLGLRTHDTRMAGELAARERDIMATIAHTDALTGLLNRRGLQAAAAPLLAQCNTSQLNAVYLIDLDRFKPINDIHGHDAGDAVLRELSTRLRQVVRNGDLVARLGGDEFVLLVGGLPDDAAALAVAQKLLQAVEAPFLLDGHRLEVGMTVGYALAPHDGRHLPDLLKRADAAMYVGKTAGRGSVRRGAAGAGMAQAGAA
ncbi:MAG: GGDEF domain-containing protein [Vitreoscilla sp.]|nr:GGDEF domain-containing protein [Vitreoscilla sp.]